jgi:hypothetical protein
MPLRDCGSSWWAEHHGPIRQAILIRHDAGINEVFYARSPRRFLRPLIPVGNSVYCILSRVRLGYGNGVLFGTATETITFSLFPKMA